MINDIQSDAKQRMEKSLSSFQYDLTKMRTGRASPAIIENIQVSYYGNPTPLKQMANIVIEDSRTLSVTPWEKNLVPDIEKAIMSADLGLNPVTAGSVIRVPLPPLTEETRRDMVKQLKTEAENARVSMRNIRRDANTQIKDLLKAKDITEDEERGAQDAIQKLTDTFINKIEGLLGEKEKDVMEV